MSRPRKAPDAYRLTAQPGSPERNTIETHPTLEAAREKAGSLTKLLKRNVQIEEWGTWYGEDGWREVETVEYRE